MIVVKIFIQTLVHEQTATTGNEETTVILNRMFQKEFFWSVLRHYLHSYVCNTFKSSTTQNVFQLLNFLVFWCNTSLTNLFSVLMTYQVHMLSTMIYMRLYINNKNILHVIWFKNIYVIFNKNCLYNHVWHHTSYTSHYRFEYLL